MNFQHRKNKILQLVKESEEVFVKEMADATNASEITIRRDLQILAADGLIYRTHGGAMRPDIVKTPVDFVNKVASRISEKDYICKLGHQFIQEGDTIFLDCGSTVFRLCGLIKSMNIRVITNSLPVVHELMNSSVQVNLIGGELDKTRHAVHGRIAVEHIQRYKADKAFLGVDGISALHGLSANSESEAEITLAMASAAQEVILLCDSSKIGKDRYLQFAGLGLINILVTNEMNESVRDIENEGVKVIYK